MSTNGHSVDLLAIAPPEEEITIGKHQVKVRGLSLRVIAPLLTRFPPLLDLMTGRDVSVASLFRTAPDAVAAIMAAGYGKPSDVNAEGYFDSLGVGTQTEILEAIVRLTFHGGFGPFVDRVVSFVGQITLKGAETQETPANDLPPPSSTSGTSTAEMSAPIGN